MAKEKEIGFDEALEKLQGIITKLEAGSLPLEASIELYKEGMSLSKVCHEKLQNIEAEVVKLVDEAGNVTAFESE